MIELLSRLTLDNESLDAAYFRPKDPSDLLLAQNLNELSAQDHLNFTVQIDDDFDERITLPTTEDLSHFKVGLVSFNKKIEPGHNYFFTSRGLFTNLNSSDITKSKTIHILEDFSEFKTLTCSFKKWNLDQSIQTDQESSDQDIDARKIVSDFTGSQIDSNHLFWVTINKPGTSAETNQNWLEFATPKASILLLSEISNKDGKITYTLKGNRNLEFPSDTAAPELTASQHTTIHNALTWIFETSREAEIRHTLLCQRLAHNDPKKSEAWIKFVSRTIQASHSSAKEDYKNHLLIKTGDLLKAITDIRKTVSDETNKVIEKTNALTSSLLRDASITFIIATLRQTLISKNILTSGSASFLLLATASWLITSICLTSFQNKLFIQSQIRFRRNWSKGLSSLVPESELRKISKRPLKEAISNYKKVKNIVNLIYAIIVIIIIGILIFE